MPRNSLQLLTQQLHLYTGEVSHLCFVLILVSFPSGKSKLIRFYNKCIALRKTGPSSPGPVHYNTGPANIIQKYGTGPVDSVKLGLNSTVRQIVRS